MDDGNFDMDPPSALLGEEEMEGVQKLKEEIQKYKDKYSSMMNEIDVLEQEKKRIEDLGGKYQERVEKMKSKISDNEEILSKNEEIHKVRVMSIREENLSLEKDIQEIRRNINYFEKETENLKEICSSGMQRKMIFKGNMSNNTGGLIVKHQIKYPVNGGSALITFQQSSVAAKIIAKKYHTINIEECYIHVKAYPIDVSVLDALCMDMSLSPSKILIYNLPSKLKEDLILDKLELFFGKSKNGGGEVDKREFLQDCRSAILTFVDDTVAARLVARKSFHVPFGDITHQVSVAPSLEGNIQDYKMTMLECNRTVLITGIPDIAEKDNMRDLLEIYFQKPSHGGGEVQELLYCPEGKHTYAFFEDGEENIAE